MAACKYCGAAIVWTESKNGRPVPTDGDGTPHFATCGPYRQAKRVQGPRNGCTKCGSFDATEEPGSGQHHALLRCNDCGATRWLSKPQTTPQA